MYLLETCEQYNAQWFVEKNGYLSPAQARQAWHTRDVTQAPHDDETNVCVQGTACENITRLSAVAAASRLRDSYLRHQRDSYTTSCDTTRADASNR